MTNAVTVTGDGTALGVRSATIPPARPVGSRTARDAADSSAGSRTIAPPQDSIQLSAPPASRSLTAQELPAIAKVENALAQMRLRAAANRVNGAISDLLYNRSTVADVEAAMEALSIMETTAARAQRACETAQIAARTRSETLQQRKRYESVARDT